ncbi:MAG TPA: hypothetical protein VHS78_05600 [Candidatus Elarobacter sp.]|jgi:hypothetical protein|nr:hypothetical protein [Candidatus Elarobacter sp.]
MDTAGWRGLLLSFCSLTAALLLFAVSPVGGTNGGTTGAAPAVTTMGFQYRLTVSPGGPAERAGLRTGDRIDLRALAPAERFAFAYDHFMPGNRVVFPRLGDDGRITFVPVVAAGPVPKPWYVWAAFFGELWFVAFATLLAWRRPDSKEARILALLLAGGAFGLALGPNNFRAPWPVFASVTYVLAQLVGATATSLLAAYATLFAPVGRLRRALAALSYGSAGVFVAWVCWWVIELWAGIGSPSTYPVRGGFALQVLGATWAFPALCMLATLAQAPRSDRARLAWTTGPLLFFYTMESVAWFAGPHLPIVERRALLNVAILLAPLGLTYALLNRRVMDIGFVLNRAAVFSSVSVVIVGVFVLVEWLLSDWTQRAGHSTNIVVTGALALALGLSIRYVHARVERVVDRVLFRRRREDEEAIRSLGREAPYITEPGALLTATVDVLRAHAGAAAVHVLLHDGRTYGGVDENDPAIVALRARRDVVDLHGMNSRIAGELAYPLIARGRLTGALVLGPKRSGESYAPDESQAIAHLALTVAAALDSLSITRDLAREDIGEAIRTMNERLADLPAAIVKALATEVR